MEEPVLEEASAKKKLRPLQLWLLRRPAGETVHGASPRVDAMESAERAKWTSETKHGRGYVYIE